MPGFLTDEDEQEEARRFKTNILNKRNLLLI
jgi:hypothetical protein